jgi:putative permease
VKTEIATGNESVRGAWLVWVKIAGLLSLIVLGFAYLTTVKVLFIPFLCAVILNVLLAPLVASLERKGVAQQRAVALVFLTTCAAIAVAAVLIVGHVSGQVADFEAKWPDTRAKIDKLLLDGEAWVNASLPPDKHLDMVSQIPAKVDKLTNALVAELPTIISEGVLAIALIFVFSFFLLRDGRELKRMIVAAVPNRYFEMTLNIIHKVKQQVSNYLQGLTIESTVDGIVAVLLCWALGVPNALLIGFIIGATTPIPVAGLIISAIVCPIIAIFSGGATEPMVLVGLVWMVIAIAALIDNIMVAPLVMGHSVSMHPVAIIAILILGGKLFGILGIVLAVPTMSVLMVVIQEGYRGIKSNEYYLRATL